MLVGSNPHVDSFLRLFLLVLIVFRLKEDRGLFACAKDFNVNTIVDIINNIGPKFTAVPSKRATGLLKVN